jgi:predicted transcriptional regulator
VKLSGQRAAATVKVETKYLPAITQIRTVTKETIRYVPQFVHADDCPLPGGFRVLHDAAAKGLVPDPAGVPDAAPAPAQDVAATVADNYGACLENAKQLEGLQEWIHEQQQLNPAPRP